LAKLVPSGALAKMPLTGVPLRFLINVNTVPFGGKMVLVKSKVAFVSVIFPVTSSWP
jgi:hypothetical protein